MSDESMITYSAEVVRNDKLWDETGEAHLRIAGKDVFVPGDWLAMAMQRTVDDIAPGDLAGSTIAIALPQAFALANGLPLLATDANIHGLGPDTAAGPNPSYRAAYVEAMSSIGEARTVNNVMRHEYRVLSDPEKAHMKKVKDLGVEFIGMLEDIATASGVAGSRELALARTKMEEAVMWAVKHITR